MVYYITVFGCCSYIVSRFLVTVVIILTALIKKHLADLTAYLWHVYCSSAQSVGLCPLISETFTLTPSWQIIPHHKLYLQSLLYLPPLSPRWSLRLRETNSASTSPWASAQISRPLSQHTATQLLQMFGSKNKRMMTGINGWGSGTFRSNRCLRSHKLRQLPSEIIQSNLYEK